MNNYIRSVLDRSDKIRCSEGVVNNKGYAVCMGYSCCSVYVRYITVRVAESLDIYRPCILLYRTLDLIKIMDICKGRLYAV